MSATRCAPEGDRSEINLISRWASNSYSVAVISVLTAQSLLCSRNDQQRDHALAHVVAARTAGSFANSAAGGVQHLTEGEFVAASVTSFVRRPYRSAMIPEVACRSVLDTPAVLLATPGSPAALSFGWISLATKGPTGPT